MNKKDIINYIKTLSDNEKIQELLIESLGYIILKQKDNVDFFIKENNDKIIHIRDWIVSIIENNETFKKPRVLTIDALNNIANKYFEKKNNKLITIKLNERHEKLIADLGDYYVIQMLSPEALDNESKQMQNCIGHGGYDRNLSDQSYKYLSLRDKFNKAHVTMEIFENKIIQLRGKQNKIPDKKYLEEILLPWLIKNNYKLDLNKYDLIFNKNDNKIYSIYNIPDNCKIDGDLDLSDLYLDSFPNNLFISGNLILRSAKILNFPKDIIIGKDLNLENTKIINGLRLPDNLIINGNLNLNCSNITKLPKGLVVKGDLYLSETNIKELPEDIKIGGNLNLRDSTICKLNDNLVINGNLILNHCDYLKKLPNGLVVNGNLDLTDTNIEKLPENIKIKKTLDLSRCKNLKKLPDNLHIPVNLVLMDCENLNFLPKNLKVDNKFDLIGSNIKELPDDIIVGNKLELHNSKIEKLSNSINKIKNLRLSYSKIKKLPDNLYVEEDLDLYRCFDLEFLSNNLYVGGNLCLSCTNIEKLPDNLIVMGSLFLNDTKIKELPKKLNVFNTLNVSKLEILEIPEDIKLGKFLNITWSKIKKLPDNLKVEDIIIDYDQINLINEKMDIQYISVYGNKRFTKENFLREFSFKIYHRI